MADNPDEPDLPHARRHRSRAREGSGLVGKGGLPKGEGDHPAICSTWGLSAPAVKGGDPEYLPIAHQQRPWSLLGGQSTGSPQADRQRGRQPLQCCRQGTVADRDTISQPTVVSSSAVSQTFSGQRRVT